MIRGIHHINFIVRDLAAAVPVWERILGCPCESMGRLGDRGVDIARFRLGDAWIVLVQPTGPGVPADFLAEHGEGFFLLSLGTDSLEDEIARVGEALTRGPARKGLDDWCVQDLDAGQTFDAQLQFTKE